MVIIKPNVPSGRGAHVMSTHNNNSPSTTTTPRNTMSFAMVSDARAFALSGFSCNNFEYAGRKAAESAPSPNNLRAKFGIKKAKKNAEEAAPAPKVRLIAASLPSPAMRLSKVIDQTVRVFFSKLSLCDTVITSSRKWNCQ